MKYSDPSPERIEELNMREIFVFGSNKAGRHGKGAAKQALKFGAIYGNGLGLSGKTYAIPTKNWYLKALPLRVIEEYVFDFLFFAHQHQQLIFLVTEVGCGLAGYSPKEIAPMFRNLTSNVRLPIRFLRVLEK